MTPTDILSLIWKKGWSLRQIALDAGVSSALLSIALRKPNPKAEKIIIDFLGMSGHELWPDRYAPDGARIVPNLRRTRRGLQSPGKAA